MGKLTIRRDQRPRIAAAQDDQPRPVRRRAGSRLQRRTRLRNRSSRLFVTSGHPEIDHPTPARLVAHALMNRRDLLDPAPALGVLQVEDFLAGPVEVISDEGYLLLQRLEGVADYPPSPFSSTSKACSQRGQHACTVAFPIRLIRL